MQLTNTHMILKKSSGSPPGPLMQTMLYILVAPLKSQSDSQALSWKHLVTWILCGHKDDPANIQGYTQCRNRGSFPCEVVSLLGGTASIIFIVQLRAGF